MGAALMPWYIDYIWGTVKVSYLSWEQEGGLMLGIGVLGIFYLD